MRNILIISWYTLREAMARKVFMFFAGISVLVLLGSILVFSLVDAQSFISTMTQGQAEIVVSEIIAGLELLIISPLAGLCLLLAIFSSASFVPVMLEKGTIDLLLSKPISRLQLLIGKYLGGLLVVFINILFLIVGVWLIISLKFSYWDFSFLLVSLTVTFAFAVLYSIIVLFGVITKSSILGMMVAYLIFLILSPLLQLYKAELHTFVENGVAKTILDGLYYIIPQTAELMGKLTVDLAAGHGIDNFSPVLTSFFLLVLMLSFSIYLFRKKDF